MKTNSLLNNFDISFLFKDNLEHFEPVDHEKSTVYDEQLIDKIQFSSLLVSFFGLQKNELVVSALIDYFRSNYKELEEEKNEKKSLVCLYKLRV